MAHCAYNGFQTQPEPPDDYLGGYGEEGLLLWLMAKSWFWWIVTFFATLVSGVSSALWSPQWLWVKLPLLLVVVTFACYWTWYYIRTRNELYSPETLDVEETQEGSRGKDAEDFYRPRAAEHDPLSTDPARADGRASPQTPDDLESVREVFRRYG